MTFKEEIMQLLAPVEPAEETWLIRRFVLGGALSLIVILIAMVAGDLFGFILPIAIWLGIWLEKTSPNRRKALIISLFYAALALTLFGPRGILMVVFYLQGVVGSWLLMRTRVGQWS